MQSEEHIRQTVPVKDHEVDDSERQEFNGKLYQICIHFCGENVDDDFLNVIIGKIYEASKKTALKETVSFLISQNIHPQSIISKLEECGIELPHTAYTDWGLCQIMGHQSPLGSVGAHFKAIRNNTSQWFINHGPTLMGMWAVGELLSRAVVPAAAAPPCDVVPGGSYLETCEVKTEDALVYYEYHSDPITDSRVYEHSLICRYEMKCKTETGALHDNFKIIPRETVECFKYKNQNGTLVLQSRKCSGNAP